MGRESRVLSFDLADRAAAKDILEADIQVHGAYYGVVCNAGLSRDNAFPALSGEDWDQVLRSNLDGFYNVLSPLVMPMIQRRKPGRIVTFRRSQGLSVIEVKLTIAPPRRASSAPPRRWLWNWQNAKLR